MLKLNKKVVAKKFTMDSKSYNSVCNSCSCTSGGGGCAACNSTCKGCQDKGQNIAAAKKVYSK